MTIEKDLEVSGEDAILKMRWNWKREHHISAQIWIDGKLVEDGGVMLVEDFLAFADLLRKGLEIAERTDKQIRQ